MKLINEMDIIVKRAEEVIDGMKLTSIIVHRKEYKSNNVTYSENDMIRHILKLGKKDNQKNYLFVGKVVKQINMLLT